MWHWDLGDGSPVISEDHPGTAFPDPTGYFHYRQPGNYTITLTIEWEAEFSANQGATWQTIPGTGQTTASLDIEVGEHRPASNTTPNHRQPTKRSSTGQQHRSLLTLGAVKGCTNTPRPVAPRPSFARPRPSRTNRGNIGLNTWFHQGFAAFFCSICACRL